VKSAIKGFVALLLVLGMAAPALALDGDLKGYFNIRALTTSNVTDRNSAADDNRTGVDQRMRLWFTGALNENVKGVFAVENDVTWGDADADYGLDYKADLEIKSSYIQFNAMDAKTTVGLQGFSLGRGFVMADDAPGLQIVKKIGDMNLLLAWVHAVEGSLSDDSADQDVYAVQLDLKAGGFSVVPVLTYIAGPTGDNTNIIFGASVDGKAGDIGLAFTLLGSSWDTAGTGPGSDGFGIVAYGKASMGIGDVAVSAEAGYIGDEDAAGGNFQAVNASATGSSAYATNFAEVLTGGKFDGRGTVGHQAVGDTIMNWLYGKLAAKAKVDDKSNVEAALIYAAQAVDVGVVASKTFGFEFDAYYNRTLVEGLTATIGGGYLFTDDDFGTDNAYKLGTMLTYSF
jgi:hypothetical protein